MATRKTMRDLHPMLRRSEPQADAAQLDDPQEKPKRIARTFYLDADLVEGLDRWVKETWQPGTKRPEISTFVNQAIRKALNLDG